MSIILAAGAARMRLEVENYEDKIDTLETRIAELEKALTALVELNNNYSPFGGELFQDRVERTWEAASRVLGGNKDD